MEATGVTSLASAHDLVAISEWKTFHRTIQLREAPVIIDGLTRLDETDGTGCRSADE